MEKSLTIGEIGKALIVFHNKVSKVKKDATNPFFKSKYASLSNILEAVEEPLRNAGLSFAQFPSGDYGLTTILMHESGEYIQDTYQIKPVKDDPQGRGSSITYQRRYALAAVLGLNIDEDDDANTATHGGSTPEKAAEDNKPWLNKDSKDYEAIKARLKAGTASMKQIREHYKVSKTMEAELTQLNGHS